jgi:hypothetical protein
MGRRSPHCRGVRHRLMMPKPISHTQGQKPGGHMSWKPEPFLFTLIAPVLYWLMAAILLAEFLVIVSIL